MSFVLWMWVIWIALLIVFIGFRVYVSRMSRNEDDHLALQDSSAHLGREQAAIAAQLEGARPVGRAILAVFSAMTIYVAGYYVIDMVRQFR
ncbi:MAG TPA: hypothetical protein VG267_13490 [Terracidiphilus sp.]|nr:hypothetical protein [Terracidiphilus sp.]